VAAEARAAGHTEFIIRLGGGNPSGALLLPQVLPGLAFLLEPIAPREAGLARRPLGLDQLLLVEAACAAAEQSDREDGD
jgi:hypothetical protein